MKAVLVHSPGVLSGHSEYTNLRDTDDIGAIFVEYGLQVMWLEVEHKSEPLLKIRVLGSAKVEYDGEGDCWIRSAEPVAEEETAEEEEVA